MAYRFYIKGKTHIHTHASHTRTHAYTHIQEAKRERERERERERVFIGDKVVISVGYSCPNRQKTCKTVTKKNWLQIKQKMSLKTTDGIISIPFSNKPWFLTWLQYKSFENTVGKGEIARNEPFLIFPKCLF